MYWTVPPTGGTKSTASWLIKASMTVHLYPKEIKEGLHYNSLSCHINTSITPHGSRVLIIQLPLVDWHVQCLGQLHKLLWVAVTKVSYKPPLGIMVSACKLIVVIFFLLFIVSN
jgi:hypothetical protein